MATIKKLNVPFLIKLFAGTFVFSIAVFFLHGYQVRKNAVLLLRRADEAREEDDLSESARLRMRYLSHNPEDPLQYREAALDLKKYIFDKLSNREDFDRNKVSLLFRYMEEATQRNGDDIDLRREAADFYFNIKDWGKAIDNLEAIEGIGEAEHGEGNGDKLWSEDDRMMYINSLRMMGGPSEDKAITELEILLGYDSVTGQFDKDKAKSPEILDAYQSLAVLLVQRKNEKDRARLVLDQMCIANPNNAQAFINRANLIRRIFPGNAMAVEQSHKDIQTAYALDPADVGVITAMSTILVEQKQPEKAKTMIKAGIEKAEARSRKSALYQMLFKLYMTTPDALGRVDQEGAVRILDEAIKAVPRDPDLLWAKARMLLDEDKFDEVEGMYSELERAGQDKTMIQYLQARILMKKNRLDVALPALERIRPALKPNIQLEVDVFLIDGYGKKKEFDRQLAAIRRMREINPNNERVNQSYLSTLMLLKRYDEARDFLKNRIRELQAAGADVPQEYFLIDAQIAMNAIDKGSTSLTEDQDRAIRSKIENIFKNENFTELQKQTLLIEYFRKMNDPAKAKNAIRKAIKSSPNIFALWPMLLDQAQSEAEASSILNEMKTSFGSDERYAPTMRVMQAKIAAKHSPETAGAVLNTLEQGMDSYEDKQRSAVLYEFARIHSVLKNDADANRLLEESLALDESNQQIILETLFENAISSDNLERIDALTKRIRDSMGTDNITYRMAEARTIIWKIRYNQIQDETQKKQALSRARQQIEIVRNGRREWPNAILVASDIERLDGNPSGAIDFLEQAYELQKNNPNIIRMIAESYRKLGQAEKVNLWMGRLPHRARSSRDDIVELQTLYSRKDSWGNSDKQKAASLLENAAPADSDSAIHQMLRSKVLLALGQATAAEKAANRAIDVGADNLEVWPNLVGFYADQGQNEKAMEVIKRAETTLPEATKPVVIGRCYLILKNFQQAFDSFGTAAKNNPDNLALQQQLAEILYEARQPLKAAQLTQRILSKVDKTDPKQRGFAIWGRRRLANVLIQTNSYENFDKALALLEQNSVDGKMAPSDLSLYLRACQIRTEKSSWTRALNKLAEVSKIRQLSDDELLLKANLLEKFEDQHWDEIKKIVTTVLARRPGDKQIVEPYVKWLLKRGEIIEAERLAERNLDPKSVTRFRMGLYADAKRGNIQKAAKELQQRAPKIKQIKEGDRKALGDLATFAAIAEELGQFDPRFYQLAENLMSDVTTRIPGERLRLAAIIGLNNKTPDKINKALQLCLTAKDVKIPEAKSAGIVLAILREHADQWDGALKPSIQQVEKWFDQIGAANADNVMIQWRIAEFHDMIGNLDRVETQYKAVLPKLTNANERGMVMNNLAYAMALNNKTKEPLAIINEANALLGDNADLLDTRGYIYYAMGETDKAISEFEDALENGPKSGHKLFHLALAYDKKGDKAKAKEAINEAIEMGLSEFQLPRALRPDFKRLQQTYR